MPIVDHWDLMRGRVVRNMLWLLVVLMPTPALAYVGPGLGIATIGVVFGILLSIILALFAILWYPIKALWRKIRTRKPDTGDSKDDSEAS